MNHAVMSVCVKITQRLENLCFHGPDETRHICLMSGMQYLNLTSKNNRTIGFVAVMEYSSETAATAAFHIVAGLCQSTKASCVWFMDVLREVNKNEYINTNEEFIKPPVN
jgi:hypothetical protein